MVYLVFSPQDGWDCFHSVSDPGQFLIFFCLHFPLCLCSVRGFFRQKNHTGPVKQLGVALVTVWTVFTFVFWKWYPALSSLVDIIAAFGWVSGWAVYHFLSIFCELKICCDIFCFTACQICCYKVKNKVAWDELNTLFLKTLQFLGQHQGSSPVKWHYLYWEWTGHCRKSKTSRKEL